MEQVVENASDAADRRRELKILVSMVQFNLLPAHHSFERPARAA